MDIKYAEVLFGLIDQPFKFHDKQEITPKNAFVYLMTAIFACDDGPRKDHAQKRWLLANQFFNGTHFLLASSAGTVV